jgi:hypothetical protein
MKRLQFTRLILFLAGTILLALKTPAAFAQGATQLGASFSGGKVVQSVQLSGDATWHAGSLEDSGTVTLTASPDGSSRMQLFLGASGQRTETRTGTGTGTSCQWAGADGVVHAVDLGNCWRPTVWFLPSISFQPSLPTNSLGFADLGLEAVGSGTTPYRHLRGQLNTSGLPISLSSYLAQQGSTDIGLDPLTLLPAVLAYSICPDSGAQNAIAIEVHYSDYRTIDGVQIPFLIQRYVNGSLQLEIRVNTAQIN